MEKLNKKVFGTLFFSLFITITGVGIVVPLLPVYAHDLGASGLYIGLIYGSFSLSRTVFLPYFGRRSDRQGRKPFIVLGLLGYSLISFAFISATSVEMLIAIRFVQGIASAMIMPVAQAYIGDITTENQEGFTMGLFNMSVFIGLSLGPLIGGMLNDRFNLQTAFISMGILSLFGFFLSLVLLPAARSEQVVTQAKLPVDWRFLLKDRTIDGICLFRLVYTACIGMIWGFLPVYADAEFSLSSSATGILVMLGVLTAGILQTPMGYLADRRNKRVMIITGGLIIVFAMLLFQGSLSFRDLFLANVVFGVGGSLSMAPLMAIAVQKGTESRAMGAVMSLLTMSHSSGMLLGAFIAGLMMDLFALRQIFLFGAWMMLTGVILFFVFTIPSKNPVETEEFSRE